jgi:hypothetical protein
LKPFKVVQEPPRGNFKQEEYSIGDIHVYVTREKEAVAVSVFDGALRSTFIMTEERFHEFVQGLAAVSAKLRE